MFVFLILKFIRLFLNYAQGALVAFDVGKMLEKWKNSADKSRVFGALLIDLSKAFDWLDHEFLNGKFHAYGFSLPALRLICEYLSNRTKIGYSSSCWFETIFGVPQGSILEQFLFNIFLADLSFDLKDVDIANFACDNTLHTPTKYTDVLIKLLEKASNIFFQWFKENLFKDNSG